MCKRILVPSNGWALAKAELLCVQDPARLATAQTISLRTLVSSVLKYSISDTSHACYVPNQLAAETREYLRSISNRVESNDWRISFSRRESSTAVIPAVADAMTVDMIRNPHLAGQTHHAGEGMHRSSSV